MSGLVYLQRALCAVRALTYCCWKTFITSVSKFKDFLTCPELAGRTAPLFVIMSSKQ